MIPNASGQRLPLLEAMESLWLLAKQAERTIRETGHQVGCPQCPCGASQTFPAERAEFYRQWRAVKNRLTGKERPA